VSDVTLYHFTCDHGFNALGEEGMLCAPVTHPFLGCSVVWLTTQAQPDRESTGLGMTYTSCDRMKYCYEVSEPEKCRPWLGSLERFKSPLGAVEDLERYGDPEHWWITAEPTKAKLTAAPQTTPSEPGEGK